VDPDVWIGLATVEQRPGAGVLMDENKAFVHVLALASDEAEYRLVAVAALGDFGFDLVELEDIELLEHRLRSFSVDDSLLTKADEVRATGYLRFGPFITWTTE
jgi:hypothetical protein